jgi:hypothetical protein
MFLFWKAPQIGFGLLKMGFFSKREADLPPVPFLDPENLLITVAAYESWWTGTCLNAAIF